MKTRIRGWGIPNFGGRGPAASMKIRCNSNCYFLPGCYFDLHAFGISITLVEVCAVNARRRIDALLGLGHLC